MAPKPNDSGKPKHRKGLAAMDPEKAQAIRRLGAVSLWLQGKAHRFTKEESERGRAKILAAQEERLKAGLPRFKPRPRRKVRLSVRGVEQRIRRVREERVRENVGKKIAELIDWMGEEEEE